MASFDGRSRLSLAAIVDLKDPNGLPLDTTGQSFRSQFRKSYTSANLTDFINCLAILIAEIIKLNLSITSVIHVSILV